MAITFGRFSDSYKPQAKTDAWGISDEAFTKGDYYNSYASFFDYLKDDSVDNVKMTRAGDNITFEIMQGSQIVKGTIANNKIVAESYVAEYDKLSVAFMRRLMDLNYQLYYSRFCLKDNKIVIKFDSTIPGGSPRKLYYALKEVATRADKQDDLLTDDFSMLKSLGNTNNVPIPENERETKHKYFRKWIGDTIERINSVNEDAMSGGISYLLLNLLYKIDYFIVPEGILMNELEKISWGYFAKDNKPFLQKNADMKQAFMKLLTWTADDITSDIYRTKSTFGIANPVPHQAVLDLFANNVNNIKWYIDNKYEDIAIVIYEYLATYCLFSYGMQKPTVRLFHLMLCVTNQDFLTALGVPEIYYDAANKKINEQLIKDEIAKIISDGVKEYPELKFNTANLKFDTVINLLRTYIEEIKLLNYNN